MPRVRRLTYPGGFYHIFNRGLNQARVFLQTTDYSKFLKKVEELLKDLDFVVYCYSLLPNHFHFLIETKKTPLAKIMARLLTSYGVYFSKKYDKRGPVFEDRYKSILVQQDTYFLELSRYIHLNPVKARLASNPEDYPYSSFAEIVGKGKFSLLDKKKLERLVGHSDWSLKDYIEFVYGGLEEDLSEFDPWKKGTQTLGSSRFSVNRMKKFKEKRLMKQ